MAVIQKSKQLEVMGCMLINRFFRRHGWQHGTSGTAEHLLRGADSLYALAIVHYLGLVELGCPVKLLFQKRRCHCAEAHAEQH